MLVVACDIGGWSLVTAADTDTWVILYSVQCYT